MSYLLTAIIIFFINFEKRLTETFPDARAKCLDSTLFLRCLYISSQKSFEDIGVHKCSDLIDMTFIGKKNIDTFSVLFH